MRRAVLSALLLAAPARAADPKDASADPLPPGAKARLGTARMYLPGVPGITPLPPKYDTFLVADPRDGVRRRDLATGRPLGDGKPGEGFAKASAVVAVSADGSRAAVVSGRGPLAVVDAKSGEVVAELTLQDGTNPGPTPAGTAALSADGTVAARYYPKDGDKTEVVVWGVDKNEVRARVTTPHPRLVFPFLSPDGKTLVTYRLPDPRTVTSDRGQAFQVWDVATGKERFAGRAAGGPGATAVAISPDGTRMAAAAGSGSVDLWDLEAGRLLRTLSGRPGQGFRVAFSPDGKTVAAAARGGAVERWRAADGSALGATDSPVPFGDGSPPRGVAFADNERVVAWGSLNETGVVWEAPSGKLLTPSAGHAGPVTAVAFGGGGKEVVTAGQDGRVVRWDPASGKQLGPIRITIPELRWNAESARTVYWMSPDAARGVTIYPTVAVRDLTGGKDPFPVPCEGDYAVTPDAAVLVAVDRLPAARATAPAVFWDLAGRRKLLAAEVPVSKYRPAAASSPDGTRLLLATRGPDLGGKPGRGLVTGWDLKAGKKLAAVELPDGDGLPHAAAADGATGVVSEGGRVWAVDCERGVLGERIEDAAGRAAGRPVPVAFGPDGKRLAAGVPADDGGGWVVRVYDWPRAKVSHTFAGHPGPVSALRFSPDGKTLASGAEDGTVLLWDLEKAGK